MTVTVVVEFGIVDVAHMFAGILGAAPSVHPVVPGEAIVQIEPAGSRAPGRPARRLASYLDALGPESP